MTELRIDCSTGAATVRPLSREDAAAHAERTARAQGRQASETRLWAVLESGVPAGAPVDTLTPDQVRALLAVLLVRAGGLGLDGTVRPLAMWGVQAPEG